MAWDPDSLCDTLTPRIQTDQTGLGGSPRRSFVRVIGVAYGARTRNLLEPQSDALRPDTPLTPKAGWPLSGP